MCSRWGLFYDFSRIHTMHSARKSYVHKGIMIASILCLVTGLFPQLDHQKRVIAKSLSRQCWPPRSTSHAKSSQSHSDRGRQPSSKERAKISYSLSSSSSQQEKKSSKDHQSYSEETQATSELIPNSEVPINKE
jgi:hypothetical protein